MAGRQNLSETILGIQNSLQITQKRSLLGQVSLFLQQEELHKNSPSHRTRGLFHLYRAAITSHNPQGLGRFSQTSFKTIWHLILDIPSLNSISVTPLGKSFQAYSDNKRTMTGWGWFHQYTTDISLYVQQVQSTCLSINLLWDNRKSRGSFII